MHIYSNYYYHRNTATTKKLDFKNSHLTSVGARTTADGSSHSVAGGGAVEAQVQAADPGA